VHVACIERNAALVKALLHHANMDIGRINASRERLVGKRISLFSIRLTKKAAKTLHTRNDEIR
jgi:hypothetical protein